MSLRFTGGERIQSGRGIGGIKRFFKGLFSPSLSKSGGTVVKATQSRAGKVAMNALKKQGIDSGVSLVVDELRGNYMKESWLNQVRNARIRGAKAIEQINKKRRGNSKPGKRKNRYIRWITIMTITHGPLVKKISFINFLKGKRLMKLQLKAIYIQDRNNIKNIRGFH